MELVYRPVRKRPTLASQEVKERVDDAARLLVGVGDPEPIGERLVVLRYQQATVLESAW